MIVIILYTFSLFYVHYHRTYPVNNATIIDAYSKHKNSAKKAQQQQKQDEYQSETESKKQVEFHLDLHFVHKLYKLYTSMPRYAILLFDKSDAFLNERRQNFMVGAFSYFISQIYIDNVFLNVFVNEFFTHVYFMVFLEDVREMQHWPYFLKSMPVFMLQMAISISNNKLFYNFILLILYQILIIWSTKKLQTEQQLVQIDKNSGKNSQVQKCCKFTYALWLDDKTVVAANYYDILVLDIKSGKIIRNLTLNIYQGRKFYFGKIPFFYDEKKNILITMSKLPLSGSVKMEENQDPIEESEEQEQRIYLNLIQIPTLQIIKSIPAPNYLDKPRCFSYEAKVNTFYYLTSQTFPEHKKCWLNSVNILNSKKEIRKFAENDVAHMLCYQTISKSNENEVEGNNGCIQSKPKYVEVTLLTLNHQQNFFRIYKDKKVFKELHFELSQSSVEKINEKFVCFSSKWSISLFQPDSFEKLKVISNRPFCSILRHLSQDFYYVIDDFQHQQVTVFRDIDQQNLIGEYRETELYKSECLRINYDQNTFRYLCKSQGDKIIKEENEYCYQVTSVVIQQSGSQIRRGKKDKFPIYA